MPFDVHNAVGGGDHGAALCAGGGGLVVLDTGLAAQPGWARPPSWLAEGAGGRSCRTHGRRPAAHSRRAGPASTRDGQHPPQRHHTAFSTSVRMRSTVVLSRGTGGTRSLRQCRWSRRSRTEFTCHRSAPAFCSRSSSRRASSCCVQVAVQQLLRTWRGPVSAIWASAWRSLLLRALLLQLPCPRPRWRRPDCCASASSCSFCFSACCALALRGGQRPQRPHCAACRLLQPGQLLPWSLQVSAALASSSSTMLLALCPCTFMHRLVQELAQQRIHEPER